MRISKRRSRYVDLIQETSSTNNNEIGCTTTLLAQCDEEGVAINATFIKGEQDPFVYDEIRTNHDQVRQGVKDYQDRLLIARDRISSRLAKAVLKAKT